MKSNSFDKISVFTSAFLDEALYFSSRVEVEGTVLCSLLFSKVIENNFCRT